MGQWVTAEQAGKSIESAPERYRLTCTHDDKLRFSGWCVLIAAVGLSEATVAKEGRF